MRQLGFQQTNNERGGGPGMQTRSELETTLTQPGIAQYARGYAHHEDSQVRMGEILGKNPDEYRR